jgi:hypothetical protein
MQATETIKYRLLAMSLVVDVLGLLSYLIPALGEWTDIAMAVLTALAIFKGYHSYGWAAFGFLEEILPSTDIIPSATLAWIYRFIIRKQTYKA